MDPFTGVVDTMLTGVVDVFMLTGEVDMLTGVVDILTGVVDILTGVVDMLTGVVDFAVVLTPLTSLTG